MEPKNKDDVRHHFEEFATVFADSERDWMRSIEKRRNTEKHGFTIVVLGLVASFFAGLVTSMSLRWLISRFRPNEITVSGFGWHFMFVSVNDWPLVAFAAILAAEIGFLSWIGLRHSVSRRRHLLDERKERNSMNKFLLQHFLPMGIPTVHGKDETRKSVSVFVSKKVQINHASPSDESPDSIPPKDKGDGGSGECIGDHPEPESAETPDGVSEPPGSRDSTVPNPECQPPNQGNGNGSVVSFATPPASAVFNISQNAPYNRIDFEQ